eukprot:8636976-Lingulodinium_polyedra.AAC.1
MNAGFRFLCARAATWSFCARTRGPAIGFFLRTRSCGRVPRNVFFRAGAGVSVTLAVYGVWP